MKKSILILFVIMLATVVFAEKIAVLPEISKPRGLYVDGKQVYITEKSKAFVYPMDDFKKVKQFIKPGEGPSEAKSTIKIRIFPNALRVTDSNKVMTFSRDGVFKEEKRFSTSISRISPLTKNLLGVLLNADKETGGKYLTVSILDKQFNVIKELYKGPVLNRRKGAQRVMTVIIPSFDYQLYEGKIFVLDTQNGFFIRVFDTNGNKLYDIDKEYKKIKVPESFKEEYFNRLKKNPRAWAMAKKAFFFFFPGYYPAVDRFWVNNGKIYATTNEKKEKEDTENKKTARKLVVLDLTGNSLKQVFVPDVKKEITTIDNGKFYYLLENEEAEAWELHAEAIK